MHVLPSPFNLCPCRLQEQKGEDPAEPRPVPKEVGCLSDGRNALTILETGLTMEVRVRDEEHRFPNRD